MKQIHDPNREPKTHAAYRTADRPTVTEPDTTPSRKGGDNTITVAMGITALIFTLFGIFIGYWLAGLG